MKNFTIRDIENLCGIKAHTLRIWEQRYKMFIPKRKESQHRIYDNEDLKELLNISFLYHNGFKISEIASLSPGEIQSTVKSLTEQENNYDASIILLTESCIQFNKEKFEKTVNCLIVRLGFEKCLKDVFFPFLHRIGLLWMTNNVIPAQEHFVSHIIRKKIILAIDGLVVNQQGENNILLFAPTQEFHEIPLLAVNYFLRKYNNQTTYFGVNIAPECIYDYLVHHRVDALYIHMLTQLSNINMDSFFINLARKYPDKKIIISGPLIHCITNKSANMHLIKSIDELIEFARLRSQHSY